MDGVVIWMIRPSQKRCGISDCFCVARYRNPAVLAPRAALAAAFTWCHPVNFHRRRRIPAPHQEYPMAVAIKKKITAYAVVTKETKAEASAPAAVTQAAPAAPAPQVISMHEKLERPEVLRGSTYKIKSPIFEHAMYVTINDVILNPGTEFEESRPFEIFVNSKNMEQFQWVVALTRVMSAVFRKGGDVTFLVEELRAVF